MTNTTLKFPEDFIWGAATSSYQIEGAVDEDGRGPSIWDTFSHTPGNISQGATGDVAADHYHHWQEDVAHMADLGLSAYRFSIAWPRIIPEGTGEINPAGLDFYDRLVDELLAHEISPFITLYHWDLPQALQDRGGWPERETAEAFADYARAVAERLGDRVHHWITHNEPWVAAMAGHFLGEHAPGIKDPVAALKATHHLLLSHGYAVEVLRETVSAPIQVGITLNLSPIHPATQTEADRTAAHRFDGIHNRLFLDPIFRGDYPEDIKAIFAPFFASLQQEDLERIAAPIDFLGVNYYSRIVIKNDPDTPIIQATGVQPEGNEYSQMSEIYPEGLFEILTRVWRDYRPEVMYITENGIAVHEGLDADGRVRDYRRIGYLRDHIGQVHRALDAGVPMKGYFVWSLLDNFEWAHGYDMRFGIIHVDYQTRKRTVKESGRWYAKVIGNNAVEI